MDGEEELEDIGDSRMYDELEAAMRADAAEVVARDSTEAELPGSDPEVDAILEGDSSEAEEAGSESGSELFGDEDISESDEGPIHPTSDFPILSGALKCMFSHK